MKTNKIQSKRDEDFLHLMILLQEEMSINFCKCCTSTRKFLAAGICNLYRILICRQLQFHLWANCGIALSVLGNRNENDIYMHSKLQIICFSPVNVSKYLKVIAKEFLFALTCCTEHGFKHIKNVHKYLARNTENRGVKV